MFTLNSDAHGLVAHDFTDVGVSALLQDFQSDIKSFAFHQLNSQRAALNGSNTDLNPQFADINKSLLNLVDCELALREINSDNRPLNIEHEVSDTDTSIVLVDFRK